MPPTIAVLQVLCLLLWPWSEPSKKSASHRVGKVRRGAAPTTVSCNLRANADVGGATCGTSHRAGRDVGKVKWSAVGRGDLEWSEVKCGEVVCSGLRIGGVTRSGVRRGAVATALSPAPAQVGQINRYIHARVPLYMHSRGSLYDRSRNFHGLGSVARDMLRTFATGAPIA